MEGMTYDSVVNMLSVDRRWYLDRLYKQLKKENDEMKKDVKGKSISYHKKIR